MNYVIEFTDAGKTPFVIKPYTTNGPATPSMVAPFHPQAVSANTSLILLGKGMYDYGDEIASNFLHVLEHFANNVAPKWPVQGQLWYKNANYTDPAYPLNPTTQGLYVCRIANSNPALVVWDELALSTLTGSLNANNFTVINVANPVNPQDAVNLQYANGAYVNVNGDTMAAAANLTFVGGGQILGLPTTPTSASAAASKSYIDTQLASAIAGLSSVYVFKVGDTMTGLLQLGAGLQISAGNLTIASGSVINVGGNIVSNGASPVSINDLATKGYVDIAAGAGGSDGTLTSGSINTLTGEVTLVSTISPPVVVQNISPFLHDHRPEEVYVNVNPVFNSSQLRQIMAGIQTYPNVSLQDVINAIDQDIFQLKARNERQLITGAEYAITGVVTGVSGTLSISGNFTSLFFPTAVFVVVGNGGTGNGTYTVASSVFATGTTTITITGTIPGGTTVSGTLRLLSYALNLSYRVERNKLSIFNNGVKQYATERGESNAYFAITPVLPYNSEVNIGDWTGLVNGAYSFNVAVNGGGNTLVTVTVAQPAFAVTGVTTGIAGKWTLSGNQTSIFKLYSQFIVQGNTGLGATTTYTIQQSIFNGVSTVITVNETISGTANVSGNLYVVYTFYNLVQSINSQFTSLVVPATCTFDSSSLFIFSNTIGIGSRIVATDSNLFSTIQTNLATTEPVLFNNPPAISQTLAYGETGIPFSLSDRIELISPLVVGTITEISLMR